MRTVKPGYIMLHFKHELNPDDPIAKYLYIIRNIARDSNVDYWNEDTGEGYIVIYENRLTGIVWARSYQEFISEVDPNKYPDIAMKYRFSRTDVDGNIIGDGE